MESKPTIVIDHNNHKNLRLVHIINKFHQYHEDFIKFAKINSEPIIHPIIDIDKRLYTMSVKLINKEFERTIFTMTST